jgi:trimethylamine--corrinoid protein Co-methyltransferase
MDNDVLGMVARVFDGIEVTDETLAINLIEEVGPIPGHYLKGKAGKHTQIWWKKEQFIPTLADRLSYSEWVKRGSRSIIARAKERVKEILTVHEPTPLPEDQDKELDRILEEAKKYYREKEML